MTLVLVDVFFADPGSTLETRTKETLSVTKKRIKMPPRTQNQQQHPTPDRRDGGAPRLSPVPAERGPSVDNNARRARYTSMQLALFVVAAFVVMVSVLAQIKNSVASLFSGGPSPAALAEYGLNGEGGDAAVRKAGYVHESKILDEMRSLAFYHASGEAPNTYGSRRVNQRVLLSDATDGGVAAFVAQLNAYLDASAHGAAYCVRYVEARHYESVTEFASLFHPDTDRAAGCRRAVVVERNILNAPPNYRDAVYKGVAEDSYMQSEPLRQVPDAELADPAQSSRIMLVIGQPPGATPSTWGSGRLLQMFTAKMSLKKKNE